MIKKAGKIKSWHIILFTALVLCTGFFAVCVYSFLTETAARRDGSLVRYTVTADDFELMDIIKTDSGYRTTNHDSQMILKKQRKFSSMKFYMEYTVEPGEIVLYYKEPGDEHFSEQKRLWAQPVDDEDNYYIVKTSMKEVSEVRLDPSMFAGNRLTFKEFSFNEEKRAADYFNITYTHIFCLILYTLVISACLKYGQEFILRKFE